MGMIKVRQQPTTAPREVLIDLKAAGTTDTKSTIGIALHCNGLKHCKTFKVPLLMNTHLHFVGEHCGLSSFQIINKILQCAV